VTARLLWVAGFLLALFVLFLVVHPPVATTFNAVPCTIVCHSAR
jgi:hypothetical protein